MSHVSIPKPAPGVLRVGLTGGIGSGKSTIASMWEKQGRHVIDLDAISRSLLNQPGAALDEVVEAFGPDVLLPGAEGVNRDKLAQIVFNDESAREKLETIVHGRVWEEVERQEQAFANAAALGTQFLVIHDSPLLFENGNDEHYMGIVAVMAPESERIERVVRERGKSREYVESIVRAQVSDHVREERADVLIDNAGAPEDLRERADDALAEICDIIDDRLHYTD